METRVDDQTLAAQLERRMVEALLRRIERAMRDKLIALGCPTRPDALYAYLDENRWPKGTKKRDKDRAKKAKHALVYAR